MEARREAAMAAALGSAPGPLAGLSHADAGVEVSPRAGSHRAARIETALRTPPASDRDDDGEDDGLPYLRSPGRVGAAMASKALPSMPPTPSPRGRRAGGEARAGTDATGHVTDAARGKDAGGRGAGLVTEPGLRGPQASASPRGGGVHGLRKRHVEALGNGADGDNDEVALGRQLEAHLPLAPQDGEEASTLPPRTPSSTVGSDTSQPPPQAPADAGLQRRLGSSSNIETMPLPLSPPTPTAAGSPARGGGSGADVHAGGSSLEAPDASAGPCDYGLSILESFLAAVGPEPVLEAATASPAASPSKPAAASQEPSAVATPASVQQAAAPCGGAVTIAQALPSTATAVAVPSLPAPPAPAAPAAPDAAAGTHTTAAAAAQETGEGLTARDRIGAHLSALNRLRARWDVAGTDRVVMRVSSSGASAATTRRSSVAGDSVYSASVDGEVEGERDGGSAVLGRSEREEEGGGGVVVEDGPVSRAVSDEDGASSDEGEEGDDDDDEGCDSDVDHFDAHTYWKPLSLRSSLSGASTLTSLTSANSRSRRVRAARPWVPIAEIASKVAAAAAAAAAAATNPPAVGGAAEAATDASQQAASPAAGPAAQVPAIARRLDFDGSGGGGNGGGGGQESRTGPAAADKPSKPAQLLEPAPSLAPPQPPAAVMVFCGLQKPSPPLITVRLGQPVTFVALAEAAPAGKPFSLLLSASPRKARPGSLTAPGASASSSGPVFEGQPLRPWKGVAGSTPGWETTVPPASRFTFTFEAVGGYDITDDVYPFVAATVIVIHPHPSPEKSIGGSAPGSPSTKGIVESASASFSSPSKMPRAVLAAMASLTGSGTSPGGSKGGSPGSAATGGSGSPDRERVQPAQPAAPVTPSSKGIDGSSSNSSAAHHAPLPSSTSSSPAPHVKLAGSGRKTRRKKAALLREAQSAAAAAGEAEEDDGLSVSTTAPTTTAPAPAAAAAQPPPLSKEAALAARILAALAPAAAAAPPQVLASQPEEGGEAEEGTLPHAFLAAWARTLWGGSTPGDAVPAAPWPLPAALHPQHNPGVAAGVLAALPEGGNARSVTWHAGAPPGWAQRCLLRYVLKRITAAAAK